MRRKDWDYSSFNRYFITICTDRKKHYFGEVNDGEMNTNELGGIVQMAWNELPSHYLSVQTAEFIVMPDHLHGIIGMGREDSNLSLSTIVGGFKSEISRKIHFIDSKFKWQKGFHDKIIYRDELYDQYVEYIYDNPRRWNSRY